uniref:NADH dehydrogenase subunit 2 n=1 Tax=Chloropicon maureeniae TaxID=1461542 RepID=A0A4D6C611_9CHLO|nr:NADH dehydrogenase subunit 2 [Chloropicon maureeniae]QBX98807.1 NADH dehydrogenase subunit 2 [Chloropicon maureeniae]
MIYLFDFDLLGLLPEVFMLVTTCILLGYGVWYEKGQEREMTNHQLWCGVVACVLTLSLLLQSPITHLIVCYQTLILDGFGLFVKGLIVCSTLGVFLLSFSYLRQENLKAFEFIILVLLACSSMMLMASSYDFISLYLSLEFQSLSFYVLAAMKRESDYSTEAGLKYFVLGAIASGLYLFGASLIYGLTGTTNFEDLSLLFTGLGGGDLWIHASLLVGIIFVSVAFFFKLAAAPFHMWAPDVYEGAPTVVTAFFSIAPKLAISAVLIRLFYICFFDFLFSWQAIFFAVSLISMTVGALGAMSQTKIKRLLAYSSIGHVGYILIGFCCGSLEGVQAVFLYLLVYLFMTLGSFGIVLSLRSSKAKAVYLSDLKNLSSTNPLLALTFSTLLFSMAGIPPLAGFLSKFYLFFAAMNSSLYSLAVVGVLTSALSCFYYIRLVKVMYFEKGEGPAVVYEQIDREKAILLGICFFMILLLFVYPSPVFLLSHAAALSFC